jgi:hypothetical protein
VRMYVGRGRGGGGGVPAGKRKEQCSTRSGAAQQLWGKQGLVPTRFLYAAGTEPTQYHRSSLLWSCLTSRTYRASLTQEAVM